MWHHVECKNLRHCYLKASADKTKNYLHSLTPIKCNEFKKEKNWRPYLKMITFVSHNYERKFQSKIQKISHNYDTPK